MPIARKNVSARLAAGILKPRVGSQPSVPLIPSTDPMAAPSAVERVAELMEADKRLGFYEAWQQTERELGAPA